MKISSFWRLATAVFAVGSIVYTTTSSRRARRQSRKRQPDATAPDYDVPVEYQKVFDQNLIIPAGWAFGLVWATVYSGLGALLVHQALPSQATNLRYQKALPWWWINWTLNAVFGRFFSQDNAQSVVISDLTTKFNLPAALALHQSLEIGRTSVQALEKYLRIPVSLYTGWLTVATVVGTPDTLLTLGLWERGNDERDVPLAAGILGATGVAGYAIGRHLNDPWYLLPFVAGFGGIATRQWTRHPLVGQTAAGLALVYAALLAYWLPKEKFRDYERYVVNVDTEPVPDPHQSSSEPERVTEID